MAMTSLSIILTVFVLQLHHVGPHQKPVPRWLRALVFDLLARMVCMGRASTFMKNRTYGKCENMYLSTFMENAEGGNCNGSVPLSGVTISHERIDHTGEVITKHIRGLVSRQDNDESHQDLIQEWQFVAHVIDRLLFWIFLFFAVVLRTILIVRNETRCRHIGYSYRLTARVLLYAPSHRQDSTYHGLCYTSRRALAVTRNSSVGPAHEGSIRRPIAP